MTDQNPFTPPESKLRDPQDKPPGSQVKAVLVGVVVDIGGTVLSTFVIAVLLGIFMTLGGADISAIERYVTESSFFSPYHLACTVAGLTFSAISAYICARIARQNEYGLAIIMTIVSTLLALSLGGGRAYSTGLFFLLTLLSLCAAIYGARLGREKNLEA